MTKEDAINYLIDPIGKSLDEHEEAVNMAVEALKRDDPDTEFKKRLEESVFCGYPFKELLIFADACRRQNISENDLHEFCLSVNSAYEYITEKIHEEFEKQIKKEITTCGSFAA